jgi:hypothetical protein
VTEQTNSRAACARAQGLDLAAFALERAGAEWAEFRAHYPSCDTCSREVARFARLAALLEPEAPGGNAHPDADALLVFSVSRAELPPVERERIARHLASCAACRSEARVLQRFDLGALAPAPSRATQAVRGALAWLGDALRAPLRAPALALVVAVLAAVGVAGWIWRTEGPVAPEVPSSTLATQPSQESPPIATIPRSSSVPARTADTSSALEPAREIALEAGAALPSARQQERAAPPLDAGDGSAVAATPEREAPPTTLPIAALVPAEPPLYAPGALAQGPLVRIGGVGRDAGPEAPTPVALGPPQLGLTSREAPSLYWYLPAPTALPIGVSVVSEAASVPLLDETLPGPHAVGIHELSLAARGLRLAPGTDHQWFVAVIRDEGRRSRDLVSGGAIRYAPASAELAARLAGAEARLAHTYAEAGLWYDAYDQLSRWAAREPDAAILRAHRTALLEQVGLASVADGALSAPPASAPAP